MPILKTVWQMVRDRGFILPKRISNALELPNAQFDDAAEAILQNARISDLQSSFVTAVGNIRKDNPYTTYDTYAGVFVNSREELIMIFVLPSYGHKLIPKAIGEAISETIQSYENVTQVVLVTPKLIKETHPYFVPSNILVTRFTRDEVKTNPSLNIYVPSLMVIPPEQVNELEMRVKNLPKRLTGDVLYKYYGYLPGTVLYEKYQASPYRDTLVQTEIYPVVLVAGEIE